MNGRQKLEEKSSSESEWTADAGVQSFIYSVKLDYSDVITDKVRYLNNYKCDIELKDSKLFKGTSFSIPKGKRRFLMI